MTHTPATLLAFRDRVAEAFAAKRVRCPVHLPSDTQAGRLIDVFKDYRPGLDYCFSGWRSMWHCLLAGIPEDELFQMILDGRSMYILHKPRRVFCSSIVGGILPVALGVAWAVKQEKGPERVWCFLGDMGARTGLFHEFWQYVSGHDLPVRVVIEDNGLSTNTPTVEVWGKSSAPNRAKIRWYEYTRTHPHVGLTTRVNF